MITPPPLRSLTFASSAALGNVYFANLNVRDGKNREKFLTYSQDFFSKALKKDEGNVYAGSGVGCVLAERGELDKARNVFQRVREVSGVLPPARTATVGCYQ